VVARWRTRQAAACPVGRSAAAASATAAVGAVAAAVAAGAAVYPNG